MWCDKNAKNDKTTRMNFIIVSSTPTIVETEERSNGKISIIQHANVSAIYTTLKNAAKVFNA